MGSHRRGGERLDLQLRVVLARPETQDRPAVLEVSHQRTA